MHEASLLGALWSQKREMAIRYSKSILLSAHWIKGPVAKRSFPVNSHTCEGSGVFNSEKRLQAYKHRDLLLTQQWVLRDAGSTSFTTSAFDKLCRVSYLRQEFLAPSKVGVGWGGETVNRGEEGRGAHRGQKVNTQIQGSINMCSRVFLMTHLPA